MFKSVLFKNIIPFILWYFSLIILAILIDIILHFLNLRWIGKSFGIIGVIILLFSFIYSLRKRKYINFSSPKYLLEIHEYLAWLGSVLLLIHSGYQFNALIPWLATLMLIIVVAFGIIGKFILKDASSTLIENKKCLYLKDLIIMRLKKKCFLI